MEASERRWVYGREPGRVCDARRIHASTHLRFYASSLLPVRCPVFGGVSALADRVFVDHGQGIGEIDLATAEQLGEVSAGLVGRKLLPAEKDHAGLRAVALLKDQLTIMPVERYNGAFLADGRLHGPRDR